MDLKDLKAMEAILTALDGLDDVDKGRVLRWVGERLGVASPPAPVTSPRPPGVPNRGASATTPRAGSSMLERAFELHPGGFPTVGDFVSASRAATDVDRVLAAATFLQDFDADSATRTLTGKEINDELKNLGHGVKNITDCLNTLKRRSPQHVIQVKKNGGAKQAWKEYKVTRAGIDHAYRMIVQGGGNEEA